MILLAILQGVFLVPDELPVPDDMVVTWGTRSAGDLRSQMEASQRWSNLSTRMLINSAWFEGTPYVPNTNIGAPARLDEDGLTPVPAIPERFQMNLAGMDCVTYPEYALAMTLSAGAPEDFFNLLRKIKYRDGIVSYETRNHYMTDWIRFNEANGYVHEATTKVYPEARLIHRKLAELPSLPERTVSFPFVPSEEAWFAESRIQEGDILLFVGHSDGIDYRHLGIAVRIDGIVHVRHARTGQTVQTDVSLPEYLDRVGFLGFSVVRPGPDPSQNG